MKKRSLLLTIVTVFLCGSLTACTNGKKEEVQEEKKEILISAAASLKEAMEEIKEDYEKDNNVTLTFNFGASGSLQKQIEEGAPADIFISAGEKQFKALEEGGFLDENSKSNIAKNNLVLIVNKDHENEIKDLKDLDNLKGYIAIGETGSVPAGQYAMEALTYYDKWTNIQEKIVYAKDVKQVVSYVESGEAVCGIVYGSDAMQIKNSVIALSFDKESHKEIVYPGGVIKESKVKEEASVFLKYLTEGHGSKVLKKYGFNAEK